MSDQLVSQRIESNLSRLRLGKIGQILDQVIRTAEDKSKSYLSFLGPPGVGKTHHLAVSLVLKACQAGQSIYFTTMEDLIVKLRKDHEAGNTGKRRSYYKSSLVIVDEVGYTPIDRDQCNLFFRLVANRYEKASTIITSNKAFADWAELFSDQVIVTAILDRMLHHSVVINIKGNSLSIANSNEKGRAFRPCPWMKNEIQTTIFLISA